MIITCYPLWVQMGGGAGQGRHARHETTRNWPFFAQPGSLYRARERSLVAKESLPSEFAIDMGQALCYHAQAGPIRPPRAQRKVLNAPSQSGGDGTLRPERFVSRLEEHNVEATMYKATRTYTRRR